MSKNVIPVMVLKPCQPQLLGIPLGKSTSYEKVLAFGTSLCPYLPAVPGAGAKKNRFAATVV
jgi:hypothetical protein